MFYPDEIIEEVRAGNDIVGVVQAYVPLRQRGNSYVGRCPFHNDKSPSFSVVPGDQFFHCFGCGAAGNVISFIMRIENYDFIDALKMLADRINYRLPEGGDAREAQKTAALKERIFAINKTAARFFYDALGTSEGAAAAAYLDNRRITSRMRKRFGLGYSYKGRNNLCMYLREQGFGTEEIQRSGLGDGAGNAALRDKFYSRLMFPIFDPAGRIVGFGGRIIGAGEPKYLNSPETVLFNKSRNLYGINYARQEKIRELILVEGYMDVISLHQAGFKNAVAALGTALTAEHARLIKRYADQAIILFDNDEAGIKASERAIPILRSAGLGIKALRITDAKDPDEFIASYGREAFAELLHSASNHVVYQVANLRSKHDLGQPEGKIAFTRDVSKLLSGLESDIERDAFTYEVSKMTNISEQSIKAEIARNIPADDQAFRLPERRRTARLENGSVEAKKDIIRIAVGYPGVYQVLCKNLSPGELGGGVYSKLLSLIYEHRANKREIHIAELLSHFTENEVSGEAVSVFITNQAQGYNMDSPALEKKINEIIKTIKRHNLEQEISANREAREIQKLMESKRNLDELYITITGG